MLGGQLWQKAVDHANSGTPSFWPPNVLKATITKEAIAEEILRARPNYGPEKSADIAQKVWQDRSGKCVQIFTILVLMNKVELLLEHIFGCQRGVRDHDLPLVLKKKQRGHKSKLCLCRADSEAVCCFTQARWGTSDLEQFETFQRRLAVPVFRLDRRQNTLIHLDLEDKDILPWCEEAEVPPVNAMSGGSGTVVRVRIHPRCHEFHETLRAVCSMFLYMSSPGLYLISSPDQRCRWRLCCQKAAAENTSQIPGRGQRTEKIQWNDPSTSRHSLGNVYASRILPHDLSLG